MHQTSFTTVFFVSLRKRICYSCTGHTQCSKLTHTHAHWESICGISEGVLGLTTPQAFASFGICAKLWLFWLRESSTSTTLSCLNHINSVFHIVLLELVPLFLVINIKQSQLFSPYFYAPPSMMDLNIQISPEVLHSASFFLDRLNEEKTHVEKLGWQVILKLV